MQINIITIGKIKEKYFIDAISEYKKRLSSFCKLKILEISAEQILDESLAEKYMFTEANKILAHIKESSYLITLEINGKSLSSIELSKKLDSLIHSGLNDLTFVIGGPNGIHPIVSERANFKLSLSKMTFPYQISNLLLIEQIYRSFKILSNEPYHR